jgi:hypothetical protein
MTTMHSQPTRRVLFVAAFALALGACAEDTVAPDAMDAAPQFALGPQTEMNRALATLRRVTAAYHDIQAAFDDGFVLLHPCEERPDEGPVGTVYVHMDRLLDGVIDPELPDALIYEPTKNGRAAGRRRVRRAVRMWNAPEPPEFLGNVFQPEDEFGVYALHVWVWRNNPEGMFAESNPHVTCGAD